MKAAPDTFTAPREQLGLPSKVFLDVTNRRQKRLTFGMISVGGALLLWMATFVFSITSSAGLEASLPDEVTALKGIISHQHLENSWRVTTPKDPSGSEATKRNLDAQTCRWKRDKADTPPSASGRMSVFAVVPEDLPWAASSLDEGCGTVDTILAKWHSITEHLGNVVVRSAPQPTQQPIWDFLFERSASASISPIIQIGQGIFKAQNADFLKTALQATIAGTLEDDIRKSRVSGFCLEPTSLEAVSHREFAAALRTFKQELQPHGLTACVRLGGNTSGGFLVVANRIADQIIFKGYKEPWIGSSPIPLSGRDWLAGKLALATANIDEEKLVLELGTFSVGWSTGNPKPRKLSYAEVMSAADTAATKPKFDPIAGNFRASFRDIEGRQHRVWMSDAISASIGLRMLEDQGIKAVSLGELGYEDPDLWKVFQGLDPVTAAAELRTPLITNFVDRIGKGPFVAPISLPTFGERKVTFDPATNQITSAEYQTIPVPSRAKLYGQGPAGSVVLTFDDGPDAKFTPQILDILQETNTPAAFFVLGSNVVRNPEMLRKIVSDGHEIGSHTFSHPKMVTLNSTRATAEVNSVQMLVRGLTGKEMRLYREPYMRSGGPITAGEVSSLLPLEQAGYLIAGMDIVPRDWTSLSAVQLASTIITEVEANSGGIVLLHDGGGDQEATVAALPTLIHTLRSKGYTFTSLFDYIGVPQSTVMPETQTNNSLIDKVPFQIIGNGWNLAAIAFWTVLLVGVCRAAAMLVLALGWKRHAVATAAFEPSVAIVIPAFNEAKVIASCIDRALASTYTKLQVIVVDDGSIDNTLACAERFDTNPRVSIYSKANHGKASAINFAISETDAEIIICIDADTQIFPEAVSSLVAHFFDDEIGAVSGKVVVGNRQSILTNVQALEYVVAQSIDRKAFQRFNGMTVVPGAIGAWRTNAVLEAGIFSSETLTEDADMTMSLIRSGYKVVFEDEAIAATEVPRTIGSLMAQRLRWSLGMLQSAWKHKNAIRERKALGIISLTDLFVFGYLMPLLAPVADLFAIILIGSLIHGFWSADAAELGLLTSPELIALVCLPFVEILIAMMAIRRDPNERLWLLFYLPFQKLFLRQILYISVFRALWRAATGSLARWGKQTRFGLGSAKEKTA